MGCGYAVLRSDSQIASHNGSHFTQQVPRSHASSLSCFNRFICVCSAKVNPFQYSVELPKVPVDSASRFKNGVRHHHLGFNMTRSMLSSNFVYIGTYLISHDTSTNGNKIVS